MVKNRLSELQARAKHAPIDEETEMAPLKKGSVAAPGGNAWLSNLESVNDDIDKVSVNIGEIRVIQKKILNSTHADPALENSMEDLIHSTKKLGTSIKATLKSEQNNLDSLSGNTMETRMRKTQINAQSKRFFDIWSQYNQNQLEFRDKSKKLLVRRCKIVNNNYTDEDIENMLDEGQTNVFATSILDQERVARQQLQELQDRHDEFMKLEKSIKEVHDMFMDVAALVSTQGEMIDSIFTHVMSAEVDLEAGKENLKKAEKYAISARKKKMCLAAVILVILLIIVFVILFEVGAFSGGSDDNGNSTPETRIIHIYHHYETTPTTFTNTTSTTVATTTSDVVIPKSENDTIVSTTNNSTSIP